MHIVTHLSDKYEKMRNSQNGWSISEAGMAQLDDIVGDVMKKLKEMGVDDNTIVVFSTDNGTEVFTGRTADRRRSHRAKVQSWKAASACPASSAGPVTCRQTRSPTESSPAWIGSRRFLTPRVTRTSRISFLKGVKLGDQTYKNHLDGYDQTAAITGKGPSARHEIFYLGESSVGAIRIDDFKYRFIDQPKGWLGEKTHWDVPDPG